MDTSASGTLPTLPENGLVAVVKADCPTCELIAPVLTQVQDQGETLTIFCQDDPAFPPGLPVVSDVDLPASWALEVETVPTLIRFADGEEQERTVGWSKADWRSISGLPDIGSDLPELRPGCGSLTVDPNLIDELRAKFESHRLQARRIEIGLVEDPIETAFDRGWSDGLPVVPPTEARVLAMLEGTTREPQDLVATIPPDLVEVTVEQVAINAVMAGCRPEYLPVVIAAVEAACNDGFNMHGLLATTYFSGPIVVVNGPIARRIGLNSEGNVFGQGNRANLTIGRALQLVVRNLGGGRPGEVDMAAQGSPGKLGFCFAEREHDSPFRPLAEERGITPGDSAVTVFAGHGPTAICDQLSRSPESLARSFAASLRAVMHPKLAMAMDAMLVVSPEHGRIFREAGWDRSRLLAELESLLQLDADPMLRGADGIDEGLPSSFAGSVVPKFRPGGLLIAHAGGDAGLFSSILGGWVGGAIGSEPFTAPIGG